jgi:hypothetical protein
MRRVSEKGPGGISPSVCPEGHSLSQVTMLGWFPRGPASERRGGSQRP